MPTYPFHQVDVFCAEPPAGNPLAVVHAADALSPARMAEFARWTNLSETAYLLEPTEAGRAAGADYRVRIFTPGGELPFAGHPTLGSAHAWLAAGGTPRRAGRLRQECGIGLVELRVTGAEIAFAAPELRRSGPADEADVSRVAAALGLDRDEIVDAAWVDNGPGWLGLELRDAATVLRLRPDWAALGEDKVGVIGPHPADAAGARAGDPARPAPADVEVRAFCPAYGVPEDPVTGSLNAGLARWLIGSGRLPRSYVAAQGTVLQRRGRVRVDTDADGTIWVGGATTTLIRGTVELPA